MVPVWSPGSVGLKRKGEEVSTSTECGGDEVAAGGRLGRSWRSRRRAAGKARAAGDVQATRGEGSSRRWSGGGLHNGDGEGESI
jgi:hypothetical protein